MSAQHPDDQHADASAPPAAPAPSVRDLLAACEAARTVSTPPRNPAPAEGAAGDVPAERGADRDAA